MSYRKLQIFKTSGNFAEATKVVKVPLVAPEPNQIRVKQIYAGVNADVLMCTEGFTKGAVFPFDLGFESLGIVDAIGSAIPVGSFTIGQPVLVNHPDKMPGFSEYSYKTTDQLFPVPDLKPEYIVALISGGTATLSLDKCGHIKPGEKVLITAAAGGTGQIALQWAKQKGAYVIGLTSTAQKAAYLRDIGADCVINYRQENLDQALTEKFPDGVDVIWETIGGEVYKTLFAHLANSGRMILLGSTHSYLSGPQPIADVRVENQNLILMEKAQTIAGFNLIYHMSEYPSYVSRLITAIQQKKIKAQVDLGTQSPEGKFFGVDQVERAIQWQLGGKNLGKVIVQLQNV